MKITDIMSNTKERQKLSWQGMFYSIQRIDLLIVSICGAGIYVGLETIKYLSENKMDSSLWVKFSSALFLIGIITNFLSQIFGFKANEQDYLMCQEKIVCNDNPNESEKEAIDKFDKSADRFSKLTNKFNYISMGLMFIGLILMMYYFLVFF